MQRNSYLPGFYLQSLKLTLTALCSSCFGIYLIRDWFLTLHLFSITSDVLLAAGQNFASWPLKYAIVHISFTASSVYKIQHMSSITRTCQICSDLAREKGLVSILSFGIVRSKYEHPGTASGCSLSADRFTTVLLLLNYENLFPLQEGEIDTGEVGRALIIRKLL